MNNDNQDTFGRLGKHYFKPINRQVLLIISATLIALAVLLAISKYEDVLNNKYQTKQQKIQQVKDIIAKDTHIKNFHAVITYQ